MNEGQWKLLRQCAKMEQPAHIPVALLADCLWIPGYAGISLLDYFTLSGEWLKSNLKIAADFPEVLFLPGFWVEFGMATEASAFGCKVIFSNTNTPTIRNIISNPDEVERITVPDPHRDGLMPLILNLYKHLEPQVRDHGQAIKIVAAKGPLTIAGHLMGMSEFLVGLKLDPENTHRLLKITTVTVKNWLEAQAEVLSEVDGMMILDDLAGFLSKQDYLEFAHPYLKEIFAAFPDWLKILHNDTNNAASYDFIADLGVNVFNFTHLQNIHSVKNSVGPEVCLMGNIPPLEILAQGTPKNVKEHAENCLRQFGSKTGLLLSAGGATLADTPGPNIRTLIESAY